MEKCIKNIVAILILILGFTSCGKNKLDLFPLTEPSENTFYSNKEEVQAGLLEVYRQLSIIYDAEGVPDLFGEVYSDNTVIIAHAGSESAYAGIMARTINADNGLILTAWQKAYKGVFMCNKIIDQLDNLSIEIDKSEVDKMRGQALVIRSLIYFDLVRTFGAVPYIDKVITPAEAYEFLRVDQGIIYENIIKDLNLAKSILPNSWAGNDIGRVTSHSAAAILGKIYLTMGENNKAKSELDYIISSNLFSLDANGDGDIDVNDIRYLYSPNTKNCKSSILEVQYMSGANAANSHHQVNYTPFYYSFSLPGDTRTDYRGNGHNSPSTDLINEFENGDPRREISLLTGYIDMSTGDSIYFPYTMKFYDPNWNYPGQNFEIIRYADILLMYSEITDDPQYLNMVRNRAGVPEFGSSGYPIDKFPTLSLAIEHERRVELCFEFHRFFDLVRTGRATEVVPGLKLSQTLFPIPQYEIDVNPKLTQNPGY